MVLQNLFTKPTGGKVSRHLAPTENDARARASGPGRDVARHLADRTRVDVVNQQRLSAGHAAVCPPDEASEAEAVSSNTSSAPPDPAAITRPPTDGLGRWRWCLKAAKELCLVGVLFSLYKLGRQLAEAQESLARANARFVHTLETQLSLPSGGAIQGSFSDGALHVANTYYVLAHFPVTLAFLVWGFTVRPRDEYVWARNLLAVQTFLALILHITLPLAPPRMFPQWGYRDTMATIGPSAYEGASAAISNQFAAMPSLHVGWAVLIAVVVARTASGPLCMLACAHALVTSMVVIITANHWWIDGVVAVALLGIALIVFPGPPHPGRLIRRGCRRPASQLERRGPRSQGGNTMARWPNAAR